MAIVRRTSKAAQDLISIGEFIAAHDLRAADRLLNRIDATCRLLAQQPELGTLREDLALKLRFFPVDNYLIFYRPIPEGIEVIRVLHRARDFRGQLE
jgi:toxin ParE1/3/4